MVTDHERWARTRDATVWGRFGIASLAATHWLDDSPRAFDGVPGAWHAEDGAAVGVDVADGRVVLRFGESLEVGGLLLRGLWRDGAVALRAYDPEAAARRGIHSIERADHDPAMRVAGRFEASASSIETEAADGRRGMTGYDGEVAFTVDGHERRLSVQRDGDELFAAFADATSGSETYPFRFLRMPAPDADGRTTVDLNRAYLPPCAFSDHYVCVFPPPQNRWNIPVRAGELRVR